VSRGGRTHCTVTGEMSCRDPSPVIYHLSPITHHSSLITHHHPSPIITHHHPSSPIITHHHQSSPIIAHHRPSSPIITHHHPSPITTRHLSPYGFTLSTVIKITIYRYLQQPTAPSAGSRARLTDAGSLCLPVPTVPALRSALPLLRRTSKSPRADINSCTKY
jgi:hypothetical protein